GVLEPGAPRYPLELGGAVPPVVGAPGAGAVVAGHPVPVVAVALVAVRAPGGGLRARRRPRRADRPRAAPGRAPLARLRGGDAADAAVADGGDARLPRHHRVRPANRAGGVRRGPRPPGVALGRGAGGGEPARADGPGGG